MGKPSAERMFRSHFSDATIERQTTGGLDKDVSYFVRTRRRAHMWAGYGDTKAKAWADACTRLGIVAVKDGTP